MSEPRRHRPDARKKFYKLWLQKSPHVFAFIGYLGSVLVLIEVTMKFGDEAHHTWSPLSILGPPTWIPINNNTRYLIGVMTLIHCVLYIAACYNLQGAKFQKNVRLVPLRYLMQGYIVTYQLGLIITFRREYSAFRRNLAVCGFAYNSAILASGIATLRRWLSGNLFDDNSQQEAHVADNSH